jgi:hypothetical protein
MEGGLIVSSPLFAGKGLGTSMLFPFPTLEEVVGVVVHRQRIRNLVTPELPWIDT